MGLHVERSVGGQHQPEVVLRTNIQQIHLLDANRAYEAMTLGFQLLDKIGVRELLIATATEKKLQNVKTHGIWISQPEEIAENVWRTDSGMQATATYHGGSRILSAYSMSWEGEYDLKMKEPRTYRVAVGIVGGNKLGVYHNFGYASLKAPDSQRIYDVLSSGGDALFYLDRRNVEKGFLPLISNGQVMPARESDIKTCNQWVKNGIELCIATQPNPHPVFPFTA